MIIRKERKLKCKKCGKRITLRSYDGLANDAWYIDSGDSRCDKGTDRAPWHNLRTGK
jgi:hypothetical protein